MKLSMAITERDKKLLYYIGLVLLVVLFAVVLIMPTLQKRTTLQTELDASDAEVLDTEDKLSQISALEQREQNLTAQWATLCDQFYPMMTNDQVDSLVTGIEMNHGLIPLKLDISGAVQNALPPFDDSTGLTTAEYSPVTTVSVKFSGQGSAAQVQELVDDVNQNYPSMRITGFTMKTESVDTTVGGEVIGVDTRYEFDAEVYMCDKG